MKTTLREGETRRLCQTLLAVEAPKIEHPGAAMGISGPLRHTRIVAAIEHCRPAGRKGLPEGYGLEVLLDGQSRGHTRRGEVHFMQVTQRPVAAHRAYGGSVALLRGKPSNQIVCIRHRSVYHCSVEQHLVLSTLAACIPCQLGTDRRNVAHADIYRLWTVEGGANLDVIDVEVPSRLHPKHKAHGVGQRRGERVGVYLNMFPHKLSAAVEPRRRVEGRERGGVGRRRLEARLKISGSEIAFGHIPKVDVQGIGGGSDDGGGYINHLLVTLTHPKHSATAVGSCTIAPRSAHNGVLWVVAAARRLFGDRQTGVCGTDGQVVESLTPGQEHHAVALRAEFRLIGLRGVA